MMHNVRKKNNYSTVCKYVLHFIGRLLFVALSKLNQIRESGNVLLVEFRILGLWNP